MAGTEPGRDAKASFARMREAITSTSGRTLRRCPVFPLKDRERGKRSEEEEETAPGARRGLAIERSTTARERRRDKELNDGCPIGPGRIPGITTSFATD